MTARTERHNSSSGARSQIRRSGDGGWLRRGHSGQTLLRTSAIAAQQSNSCLIRYKDSTRLQLRTQYTTKPGANERERVPVISDVGSPRDSGVTRATNSMRGKPKDVLPFSDEYVDRVPDSINRTNRRRLATRSSLLCRVSRTKSGGAWTCRALRYGTIDAINVQCYTSVGQSEDQRNNNVNTGAVPGATAFQGVSARAVRL